MKSTKSFTSTINFELSTQKDSGTNWESWEILADGKPIGELQVEFDSCFDEMVDMTRITQWLGQEVVDFKVLEGYGADEKDLADSFHKLIESQDCRRVFRNHGYDAIRMLNEEYEILRNR